MLDAGPFLSRAIGEGTPYAAGKIGVYELMAVRWYLKREARRKMGLSVLPYPRYIRETLFTNAGVFPVEDDFYDAFSDVFLEAVSSLDVVVAWNLKGEGRIFKKYCQDAMLAELRSLEPFNFTPPWSRALAGKRVLVISPFGKTIASQYGRRTEIWDDPTILPEFELKTIVPPFSAGIVSPESRDWLEALDKLKEKMSATDFDVAIIGAGAFSLPLAAHAKALRRIGVHLGGGTQIAFGIIGKRWEANSRISKQVKRESWVRPSAEETPETVQKIENGCYW